MAAFQDPVRIRNATDRDAALLRHIEEQAASRFSADDVPLALRVAESAAGYAAAIANGLAWIAEAGAGEPAGFIACARIDDCLHVIEMDVLPRFGQRGIGRMLLAQACRAACAIPGVRAITLTTFAHLPWNAPFYSRNGFETLPDGGGMRHLADFLMEEKRLGLRNRVAMALPCGGKESVVNPRSRPRPACAPAPGPAPAAWLPPRA